MLKNNTRTVLDRYVSRLLVVGHQGLDVLQFSLGWENDAAQGFLHLVPNHRIDARSHIEGIEGSR